MADEIVDTAPAPAAPAAAPAPTPATAAAAPNVLNAAPPAEPSDPPADPPKGFWPENWQKQIAGDDEKELKHLAKYASPEAIWKKARALEARLSSGDLKPTLSKDPKPEELAAWRKANGIPEAPDKYDIKDITISDEDKPRVAEFLKAAHDAHMTPEQAKAAISWQYKQGQAALEARAQKDMQDTQAAQDALHVEWGSGYRQNVNMVAGFLENFPEGVRELLKGGRLADGTAIFNNPDVMRGFVAAALAVNPAASIVPSGGGDPMKGIDEQIATIEKTMRTDRKAYNSNEKLQAEYRSLLEARQRLTERKAA